MRLKRRHDRLPEARGVVEAAVTVRAISVEKFFAEAARDLAVGGGFWWYYDDEMVGKTPLWQALRSTYCGIYPSLCK